MRCFCERLALQAFAGRDTRGTLCCLDVTIGFFTHIIEMQWRIGLKNNEQTTARSARRHVGPIREDSAVPEESPVMLRGHGQGGN